MTALGITQTQHPLLSQQGERLCRIERLLRAGGTVPRCRLAQDVSRATLKRDLLTLRVDFGAPVVYDPTTDGYRLAGDWPGLLPALLALLGRYGMEAHHA